MLSETTSALSSWSLLSVEQISDTSLSLQMSQKFLKLCKCRFNITVTTKTKMHWFTQINVCLTIITFFMITAAFNINWEFSSFFRIYWTNNTYLYAFFIVYQLTVCVEIWNAHSADLKRPLEPIRPVPRLPLTTKKKKCLKGTLWAERFFRRQGTLCSVFSFIYIQC